MLLVKKLSNNAIIPKKGPPGSVGYDLFSPLEAIIQPQSQCLIPTDLSIQLPKSTYGRIAPRSGLALNFFIGVGAGVVDPDYEGNVGVVLFNHSNVLF